MESECPGRSKLDEGILVGLEHRVLAFPCSDGSHLFMCMRCKQYSTGASVRGLGKLCPGKASRDGGYAWNDLCTKGRHPNRLWREIIVDTNVVSALFGSDWQGEARGPSGDVSSVAGSVSLAPPRPQVVSPEASSSSAQMMTKGIDLEAEEEAADFLFGQP